MKQIFQTTFYQEQLKWEVFERISQSDIKYIEIELNLIGNKIMNLRNCSLISIFLII
ncbi:hypothetical protein pb186bvf_003823 [Paramecium bursaria]